ncbi:MAG: hypothetical protein VZR09_10655 [Candidatus Gastranaerophilaceae bacterium]|nr:hypothetical protein [Candidatus Gastranaerophilaceae bacterium]
MTKTCEMAKDSVDYDMCKNEVLIAEIRMKVLKNRIAEALKFQRMYMQITSGKLN